MGELDDLAFVANLLALPSSGARQREQDTIDRQALMSLGGVPQEQVDQFIPPPKPPGVFEKVLSPVGTLGTVLSAVLGRPVKAPRLDMEKVGAYSALGKASRSRKIGETLAGQLKNPAAREAALNGDPDLAMKLEHPSSSQWEDVKAAAGGDVEKALGMMARARLPYQQVLQQSGAAATTGAQYGKERRERMDKQAEGRDSMRRNAPEMLLPGEEGYRPMSGRSDVNQPFTVRTVADGERIPAERPGTGLMLKGGTRSLSGDSGSYNYDVPDYNREWEAFAGEHAHEWGVTPQQAIASPDGMLTAFRAERVGKEGRGAAITQRAKQGETVRPVVTSIANIERAISSGKNRWGKPLLMDVSSLVPTQEPNQWDVGSVIGQGTSRLQRDYSIWQNAATTFDEELRLGNPDAVAMEQWGLQMPQLARSFGDVGNISDKAIELLTQYTSLKGMSQQQAAASMKNLKGLLLAIAQGDPSTVKQGGLTPEQIQARQAFVRIAFGGDAEEYPADGGGGGGITELPNGWTLERVE